MAKGKGVASSAATSSIYYSVFIFVIYLLNYIYERLVNGFRVYVKKLDSRPTPPHDTKPRRFFKLSLRSR